MEYKSVEALKDEWFNWASNNNPLFQEIIEQIDGKTVMDLSLSLTANVKSKKKRFFGNYKLEEIISIVIEGMGQEKDSKPSEVNLFKNYNKILFLLGNGGTGKTYALFEAWYNLRKTFNIAYIQLHDVSDTQFPIQEYFEKVLFQGNKIKFNAYKNYWSSFVNKDEPLIIFLDGLNEVSVEKQDKIYSEVSDIAKYWNVFIVITSRYADNLRLHIDYSCRADIGKLNDNQIENYILKIKGETYSNNLKTLLNNKQLTDLLRNPLMLSLYVQTTQVYDPTEVNTSKEPFTLLLHGIVKFYLPDHSESTIVWNYYQYQLYNIVKEGNNTKDSKVKSILAWFEINLCFHTFVFKCNI